MPTKRKALLTPAQEANAEARRAEWAEFKAWKEQQAAASSISAPRPIAGMGKLTIREKFMLQDSDEVTTVQDASELGSPEIAELARQNLESADQRTTVRHTTTKEAVVYDRRGIAKRVLRSAYLTQLSERGPDGRANYTEDCSLCGGLHPETEYDPNACPARKTAPVMLVACPARTDCPWEGRVFPEDQQAQGGKQRSKGEQLFPMTEDTRKAIGKSLALAHAWAKHPSEALGRGLPMAGQPQPQPQQAEVA